MRNLMTFALTFVLCVSLAQAQWVPSGALARVPVVENCQATSGDIAVFRRLPTGGPVIYYCQATANRINAQFPEAGRFYYVHEFAHASGILNEDRADCWAAKQLAGAPNGRTILNAAIAHFKARGSEWHPGYSTASQRANNIAKCAGLMRDSSSPSSRVSRDDDSRRQGDRASCESDFRACLSRVRSVDQCVREEFPERCIKTCMDRFGFSYDECSSRRCLATASNMSGWRRRCRAITDDEREACTTDRRKCLAQ